MNTEDCVLFSGAANGAESEFGAAAERHGIDEVNFTFERHNDAVRAEVPAERLLVYELGSGWEPLCEFLDVPVPEEEYPHVNSSKDFKNRMREMEKHMRAREQD